MTRIDTTRKLAMLALIILVATAAFAAEEEAPIKQALSGLSGTVVDTSGKPVPEFTFILEPMFDLDDRLVPVDKFPDFFQELPEGVKDPGKHLAISKVKTDSKGVFKVIDLLPGFFQVDIYSDTMLAALDFEGLPEKGKIPPELIKKLNHIDLFEPDKKLISIQFGNATFLNNTGFRNFFRGIRFALKPGVTVENVKITILPRLRIHGCIVYADGTPLAHTEIDLDTRRSFEQGGFENLGTNVFTDAEGCFTTYRDEPGYYMLGIQYENLSAGAGPFLLNEKVAPEKLVLKLNGNQVDVVKPLRPGAPAANDVNAHQVPLRSTPKSVWIVNPANGHAYKIIACKDWHDAHQQAMREEAHLVAINDEAEQHWLEAVFERQSFWIGLTDIEKEGEWQWDGGEPVTYTNWTAFEMFPDKLPDTQKDFVVVTQRDGSWQAAGPGSPLWNMARHAVIEKDGVLSTIPAEAKDMDLDIDPTVESPFGFGPYPSIPDTWPADVKYWPCRSAEHELMLRVQIKLESEGKNVSGLSMRNGLVYPNFPGTVYVEWAESGEYLSKFNGDPITSQRLQAIIKAKTAQGKPFTKENVPDDIKLVPYDEGGIDPYQFLGLQRNDDHEEK